MTSFNIPLLTINHNDYELVNGIWLSRADPAPRTIPLSFWSTQLVKRGLVTAGGVTTAPARTQDEPDVELRIDPIRGWKTVDAVWTTKGLMIEGAWETYPLDATATCGHDYGHDYDHEAPAWDCTCGFYAYAEKPEGAEFGKWQAEVELFGKVIEHDRGYRASRQRVVSLTFLGRYCSTWNTEDENCDGTAVGFQIDPDEGHLYPVCAFHAPFGYATPAQLEAKTGVEVSWRETKVDA